MRCASHSQKKAWAELQVTARRTDITPCCTIALHLVSPSIPLSRSLFAFSSVSVCTTAMATKNMSGLLSGTCPVIHKKQDAVGEGTHRKEKESLT